MGAENSLVRSASPLVVDVVGAELDTSDGVVTIPAAASAVAMNLTVANPPTMGLPPYGHAAVIGRSRRT